ncbi:MAG: HNH endonuclease signature motif containing protein [Eubacterium sp.]
MKIPLESLEDYKDIAPNRWYVDSTDGKLHSKHGKPIKGSWSRSRKYPYNSVTLFTHDGKKIHKRLDRIIACALVKGRTAEKCEVDHINGDHSDDRPKNLRWVTRQENMQLCAWNHKYKVDKNQISMALD